MAFLSTLILLAIPCFAAALVANERAGDFDARLVVRVYHLQSYMANPLTNLTVHCLPLFPHDIQGELGKDENKSNVVHTQRWSRQSNRRTVCSMSCRSNISNNVSCPLLFCIVHTAVLYMLITHVTLFCVQTTPLAQIIGHMTVWNEAPGKIKMYWIWWSSKIYALY